MPARKEGKSIRFPHSVRRVVKQGATKRLEDSAYFCIWGEGALYKMKGVPVW